MRRIVFLLLAAASALAQRPRYGGTLVVETRQLSFSELGALTGDTLVREGLGGTVQPGLAQTWTYDSSRRRWRFDIRPGVKLHDGSVLTAAAVAAALAPRKAAAQGESVFIESASAKLPSEMASAAAVIPGTGPFRSAEPDPAQRILLAAHDQHWEGRPFVDAIEIRLGRGWKEQLADFEAGTADLVELTPTEYRRQQQRGRRAWASAATDLIAIAFGRGSPPVQDERVRYGIAAAIDRGPILNVILQKLGESGAGMLPQSVSGYAFLFPAARDMVRARQYLSPPPAALTFGVDPNDPALRAVADRVALNVREAGGLLRVQAPGTTDLALVRVPGENQDPPVLLETYARILQVPVQRTMPGPEGLFDAERKLLDGGWIVPLCHTSRAYGVSARLKNWNGTARPGWGLEQVWLEAAP
ncbi:MAG: ABC transporter substrate-binding protein [Bryobacteraceae bacterium]